MTNNNYNNNYRNYDRRQDNQSRYVGAPYNFIPFSRKVWEYDAKDIAAQNAAGDDLYSGEISYRIIAKTPILIGAGVTDTDDDNMGKVPESFYKDNYGRYAIPGSSVRGLIRSNTQMLSLSSISNDIDDYELMFRSVASKTDNPNGYYYKTVLGAKPVPVHNGEKKSSVSALTRVRAGYVRNENGVYRIYDTKLDQIGSNFEMMNYYILSERQIQREYSKSQNSGSKFVYDFFIQNGRFYTQNDLARPFKRKGNGKRIEYEGKHNESYKPYAKACSYDLLGRQVTAVGSPGQYKYNGYAVSTGPIKKKKKAIYIIPQADFAKTKRFDGESLPIEITKEDERAFHIDLNQKRNALKEHGGTEPFDLPIDGDIKPIFYIKMGRRLYFGFTPSLRLFYEHSIQKGVPESHLLSRGDYAKALFGYSDANDSRKTRVSFSNAVAVNNTYKEGNTVDVILAEPKPTSYMDYVEPDDKGAGVTYNYQNFSLRGVKQYWLHADAEDTKVGSDKKNKDFVSHFNPLCKGTEFEGKVRFHNLRGDELGLLLWAMQLNGKSYMNIGKAKAFGYGVIDLQVGDVKILDPEKAYDLTAFSINPYKEIDKATLIDVFKNKLKDFLGGKDPDEFEPIKIFLAMKNPEHMPEPSSIRYMSIDSKEYQNRPGPLPTADKVMGVRIERQQRTQPKAPAQASKSNAGFQRKS